ncbi:MAG: carboxyl transferase [Clostridiales bacterium]|nr:carboxyl transferase [Clostridiales bacterium]
MSDFNSKFNELKAEATANTPARERLKNLFDEGQFTELNAYAKNNGSMTGVITAYGYVEGNPVYAFSQDITVNNGAFSKAQAEKIYKVYDLAAKTGLPIVGIYDSFGADLSDGINAMTAYGEILMSVSNLSGVVPQVSVVAGTCAGTAAMLAQSADFVIMAKDAEMFVTPNTSIENLAVTSAKAGTTAVVCDDDKAAIETAKNILIKLPQNNLSPVPMFEFSEPSVNFGNNDSADKIVRATADDESVIELYPEYGKSAYTALATISGGTVGVIATNKVSEKLTAQDCSKIARFVRTCDAFAVPVITLVDTEGFEVSDSLEVQGAVKNMTMLAHAYAEATTIKISVVTGKAYGPAYIALAGKGANSDLAYALPNAVISPLDPLAAAEFFTHDKLKGAGDINKTRQTLADEYVSNEASAIVASSKGCIDNIVTAKELRSTISGAIEVMAGKRISRLPKKHSNMPL